MAVFCIPGNFPTINEAVSSVAPGDTILVGNGVYSEAVAIPEAKTGIRIIADGEQVILDGNSLLEIAFNIMANNVEIKGFTIINYLTSGIRVSGPTGLIFLIGSKLIQNIIMNITRGDGITLVDSFATLIWQNRIRGVRDHAVNITGSTMNTWTIENELNGNGANGVINQTNANVGGTITRNRILANSGSGVQDNAGSNLIFANLITGYKLDGVDEASPTAAAGFGGIVANCITGNRRDGVRLDQDRTVVTGNRVLNNLGTGVLIDTNLNVVQQNVITANMNNGITLTPDAQGNLAVRNIITRNTPFDIDRENPQNDLVENCFQTSNPSGLYTSVPAPPVCSPPQNTEETFSKDATDGRDG